LQKSVKNIFFKIVKNFEKSLKKSPKIYAFVYKGKLHSIYLLFLILAEMFTRKRFPLSFASASPC